MPISDEDRVRFFTETAGALGRIEARQQNQFEYLEAVNTNQKATAKKLDEHMNDVNAHGRFSRGEVWALIGKIMSASAAAVAVIGFLAKVMK